MNHDKVNRFCELSPRESLLLRKVPNPFPDRMAGGIFGIAVNELVEHEKELIFRQYAVQHDSAMAQLDISTLVSNRNELIVLAGQLAGVRDYVDSLSPAAISVGE